MSTQTFAGSALFWILIQGIFRTLAMVKWVDERLKKKMVVIAVWLKPAPHFFIIVHRYKTQANGWGFNHTVATAILSYFTAGTLLMPNIVIIKVYHSSSSEIII